MQNIKTLFEDIHIIKSPVFEDNRGRFTKLFNTTPPLHSFQIQQINCVDNHQKDILRGLHYQKGPWAESKFFRILSGSIRLAIADLRKESIHYTKSLMIDIQSTDVGVLIPKGCATGYLVTQPNTTVLYYSDNAYKPESEGGIRWDDPTFSFNWQTNNKPILSEKDMTWNNFNIT